MSLTDWAERERHLIDVLFDKPLLDRGNEPRPKLLVEPQTKNYSTVGAAFDYAFRLQVARLNANLISSFPLTAEQGVKGDKRRGRFVEAFSQKVVGFLGGEGTVLDLLSDCVVLAKLEVVNRSGRDFPNEDIFSVDDDDVDDLMKLVVCLPPDKESADKGWHKWMVAERGCVLNPTFGGSSIDLRGADADLIIDGMLIDIKTTKEFKFRREYFRQLMGYHLLNMREGNMHGEFDEFGLYFSRFGELVVFPAPPMNEIELDGFEGSTWDIIENSIRQYMLSYV